MATRDYLGAAEAAYLKSMLVPGTKVLCFGTGHPTGVPATVISVPPGEKEWLDSVWLEVDDPVPPGWSKRGTMCMGYVQPLPRPLGFGQASLEI